ncbi:glycosyltransferase family 2 protein, partial [Salmonella enterica subsp. enterica]|nr:glycosyltransferase family 2 protein [Salmonella enterica subsp. enterica]
RGTKMAASPDMLAKWASSLRNCGRIALVDELLTAPADVELYRVPDVKMNVYFRRWLHIWQHLRDHPEYRFVWCTDGTDVEMLRAPW